VYDELRSRLINCGIPQNEIAFIHDADSDGTKMRLFNAVNAGRVRILIGSTEKMGAGTNVQRRLVALHHLDAPWRPRDIEQREGRILRQANLNSEVSIFRYVTEGSFDGYMWQTLETKARFINQVMAGHTSVRAAEDLEASTLTYAEIKAIASGNPAVMQKVKVDTEVRKLDQLRSAHINQQHSIRLQLHRLLLDIAERQRNLASVARDISKRDAHAADEFAMTVGNRLYSGKGTREESAKALTHAVLSWRDDTTLQVRGMFRGFEILSKGKVTTGFNRDDDRVPDIFIRGAGTYPAHLNPENTVGTVQSIEHAPRSLERVATQQQERADYLQKTLSDYQTQANRPFEHEARLKELLVRQEQINALLDLDKGERQVAEAARDRDDLTMPGQTQEISARPVTEHSALSVPRNGAQKPLENGRADLARSAMEYMRNSGMAIADMAITERTPPNAGVMSGTAVAVNGTRLAVATAANRFMVLELGGSTADVAVGADVRIRFSRGRATVEAP
jgi:hypothetical protein